MASGFTVGSHQEQSDTGNQRVYHISKNRRLVAKAWKVPPAPDRPEEVGDFTLLLALPDSAARELGRVAYGRADASDDGEATPVPDSVHTGNTLRVFAGQPDPADPSRFTIGYRLDGRTGTIDGRIRDDEIVLRPREGAPAGDDAIREARNVGIAADAAWDLTAPPAASKPSPE